MKIWAGAHRSAVQFAVVVLDGEGQPYQQYPAATSEDRIDITMPRGPGFAAPCLLDHVRRSVVAGEGVLRDYNPSAAT